MKPALRNGNPWMAAMARFCLGFGQSPSQFWSLSVPEFVALTGALVPQPQGAPGPTALAELVQQFPDRSKYE